MPRPPAVGVCSTGEGMPAGGAKMFHRIAACPGGCFAILYVFFRVFDYMAPCAFSVKQISVVKPLTTHDYTAGASAYNQRFARGACSQFFKRCSRRRSHNAPPPAGVFPGFCLPRGAKMFHRKAGFLGCNLAKIAYYAKLEPRGDAPYSTPPAWCYEVASSLYAPAWFREYAG